MQIALFLKKFELLVHDKDISKNLICEVLYQNLKKDFKNEEIKVFKGVLYINKDVFIKNAILFKKQKILDELNKVSKNPIQDIK